MEFLAWLMQKKDPLYFPPELLFDVLLRLPVKSLIRFKSVHTQWLSLISSPQFFPTHISHNPFYNYVVVRAEDTDTSSPRLSLRIFNSVAQDFVDDEALAIPYPMGGRILVGVHGSYNGLVLIATGSKLDYFILWNPSTREYLQICRPEARHLDALVGLAYDASTDDYKIVTAFYSLFTVGMDIRVYSLKSERWEKINQQFSYSMRTYYPGMTPASGMPHWLVSTDRNSHKDMVIYFDVVENELKQVFLPQGVRGWCQFISVLHGYICVGRFNRNPVIYVMKECASKKVWIKLNINFSPIAEYRCLAPVGFARKNGIITRADASGLVIYCRNTNQYRAVKCPDNDRQFKVTTYKESLESPCRFSGGHHLYVSVPLHASPPKPVSLPKPAENGGTWEIAKSLLLVSVCILGAHLCANSKVAWSSINIFRPQPMASPCRRAPDSSPRS